MSVSFVKRSDVIVLPLIVCVVRRVQVTHAPAKLVCKPDIGMGIVRMFNKTEKGLFSVDPYAEAVINKAPVKGWRLVVWCGGQDGLFKDTHKQVCVTRRHAGAHRCATDLKVVFVVVCKGIQLQDKFGQ